MEQDNIFNESFENILTSLSNFKIQVNTIHQQLKILEKNVKREFKNLKREVDKNKNKGNKKPSGFAKPTKVTVSRFKILGVEYFKAPDTFVFWLIIYRLL